MASIKQWIIFSQRLFPTIAAVVSSIVLVAVADMV
jgi:hypothetical protein